MEMSLWEDLLNLLDKISLSDEEDRVSWGLDKSKEFTTKSLYRFRTHGMSVQRNWAYLEMQIALESERKNLWKMQHHKLPEASVLAQGLERQCQMPSFVTSWKQLTICFFFLPPCTIHMGGLYVWYSRWDFFPISRVDFWGSWLFDKCNVPNHFCYICICRIDLGSLEFS